MTNLFSHIDYREMTMRPRLLAASLALFAFLLTAAMAAEPYPTRTVTIVTPFAAGSGTDVTARLIAQTLQELFGQPFVVENRSGAGGLLAAGAVARAKNDGYTLLLTTNSTHSAANGLFKNVPYDPIRDFTPIARIGSFSSFIAVHPSLPVGTIQELVAYAKANPGKLSFGVGNSTAHIVVETLKKRTGTDLVRVAYRSNPAVWTDVLAGHISMMLADWVVGLPQFKAGKIKALAVVTRDRDARLPDVPTLHETVMPNYHVLAWVGLFAPAGMPPEAVTVLADAVQKTLARQEIRKRFEASGTDIYWSGPQEFETFVKSELGSWTAMIKEAGIEPE